MRVCAALVAGWLLAALVAGLAPASAESLQGAYVNLGGGYNLLQDEHLRPSPLAPSGKLVFDGGAAAEAGLGYGFGNGLRLEIEGNYFWNALRRREGTALPGVAGGSQSTTGVMLDALYDFDIGTPYVVPYVGLGVGSEWTHWNNIHSDTRGAALSASGTDEGIGYQAILGASFPLPSLPGLSVTAEYRLTALPAAERFHGFAERPLAGGAVSGNEDITENINHSFMVGLRYAFAPTPAPTQAATAAPSAAPSAAPVPAPSRTYLVFFDWDRADLTDRAQQIIAEAAQASTRVRYTRIEVDGYTDRSGSADYNRKLSLRRADSVAAELVRDGVPREVIEIHGYGETHPLVPTAAGVREPQNRRVEILLR